MGDVVELKTKEVVAFSQSNYWERKYSDLDEMYNRQSEETETWYKKYSQQNLAIHNMTLWERIFKWPY